MHHTNGNDTEASGSTQASRSQAVSQGHPMETQPGQFQAVPGTQMSQEQPTGMQGGGDRLGAVLYEAVSCCGSFSLVVVVPVMRLFRRFNAIAPSQSEGCDMPSDVELAGLRSEACFISQLMVALLEWSSIIGFLAMIHMQRAQQQSWNFAPWFLECSSRQGLTAVFVDLNPEHIVDIHWATSD